MSASKRRACRKTSKTARHGNFAWRTIASGADVERFAHDESLRRHLAPSNLSHTDPMIPFRRNVLCAPMARRGYRWCWLHGLLAFLFIASAGLRAEESVTKLDRDFNQLLERQKELLGEAAKENPNFDLANFQLQIEQVCRGYEQLLRANPKFAAGYAAYGYLLGKVGQKKESIAMLLKANELDADQALVKNQIGNYLAEEGKPLEALPYFMAALKIAPNEPLYHYQLGTLLYEARDDFLKSGEWRQEAIDPAIHEAFRKAAELAPDRIEFTYRYAESFYHLEPPDWASALKAWSELEARAPTVIERETMRLHTANVLLQQGKLDEARRVLETVTEAALAKPKEKLVAQLNSGVEK
jgi:tetratricopeptide (TPR) repeat protein